MAKFQIEASDGHVYEVEAPDEATATAEFTKQYQPMGNAQQAVEMVKHPGRSLNDILRTTSNFITFGGRDKLAGALSPYIGTLPPEQQKIATAGADARLGTFDEAANVGALLAQPSAAARYVPASIGGRLLKMLGFAGEGAAQSGIQALAEGRDDVGTSMLTGAGLGTLGGAVSQAAPLVADAARAAVPALRFAGHIAQGGSNPLMQASTALLTGGKGPAASLALKSGANLASRLSPGAAQTPIRDTFARMLAGMDRGY